MTFHSSSVVPSRRGGSGSVVRSTPATCSAACAGAAASSPPRRETRRATTSTAPAPATSSPLPFGPPLFGRAAEPGLVVGRLGRACSPERGLAPAGPRTGAPHCGHVGGAPAGSEKV